MTNDLISREAALEILMRYCPDDDDSRSKADVDPREMLHEIENLPAVDASPVVHGRWIDNGIPESMLSGCYVCGFSCGAYTFNFCPKCGARMDEEKNHDQNQL